MKNTIIAKKENLDVVGMFTTIKYDAIKEQVVNEFKSDLLEDLKLNINKDGDTYGVAKTEPIRLLNSSEKKYDMWILSNECDFQSDYVVDVYDAFIRNIDTIDGHIRQQLTESLSSRLDSVYTKMVNKYGNKSPFVKYLEESISEDDIEMFYELSTIVLDSDSRCLDLLFVGLDKSLLKSSVKIDENIDSCVSLDVIHEIETFRDLTYKPDSALITCKGNVRMFFGVKKPTFTIRLCRTYEFSEEQEEIYRYFTKHYSYYSKLVSKAMVNYYQKKFPLIKGMFEKNNPKFEYISAKDIDPKTMMGYCTLKNVNIFYNGDLILDMDTVWGEEVSVQLRKERVYLTNYYALPMCGSKLGYVNMNRETIYH